MTDFIPFTDEQQKEHRQKWVKALRSGDYEQGYGLMRTKDDKYCVMGVACDISGLGEWKLGRGVGGYYSEAYAYKIEEAMHFGYLSIDVADYYGLNEENGSYWKNEVLSTLTSENDEKVSFNDLAYIIESEPHGFLCEYEEVEEEIE